MNRIRTVFLISISFIVISCANQNVREISISDMEIDSFSSSVKALITNKEYLKSEILKINATSPAIQRILNASDEFWSKGDLKRTNSELERALRLSKKESAVYLRLAHLRFEQGLVTESKSFSSTPFCSTNGLMWSACQYRSCLPQ